MSRRVGRQNRRIQGVTGVVVAAFGPTTVSGNAVFLTGDSGFSTGATSTWIDQSPATLGNWTQSVVGQVPSASTINGVAAPLFTGVAASSTYSFLVGPSLSSLTAGHAFVVASPNVDSLGHGMWQFGVGGAGSEEFMPYLSGLVYENFGSTTRQSTGITLTAGPQVLEFISTSTEWTFKINGVQQFTTATNTVGFSTSGTLIGCTTAAPNSNSAATSYPSNMKIGAVVVYNAKLSAGNASTVVTGLRTKYGF